MNNILRYKTVISQGNCRIILLALYFVVITMLTPSAFSQEQTGRDLFMQNRCANCHTIGNGKFVGPDLYKVSERYSRQDIIQWMVNSQQVYNSTGRTPVNEGFPPMPPMNINPEHATIIYEYINDIKLPALRPSKAKIDGTVSNESMKSVIPGTEVKLTSYLGDIEKENFTVSTSKDGRYSFADLNWDRAYVISLEYKGVEYATGKFVFAPEEYTKTFDLPVYDTTNNDSLIMLESSHIIIQIENDRASVAELSVIKNGSNAVYIGKAEDSGKSETLRFSIPENARSFQFHHGLTEEATNVSDGYLTSNLSVQPGITRLVYSYEIPVARKNIFEKKIDYQTNSQLILIADNGYDVNIEGLGAGEEVEMNRQKFLKWSSDDLQKGKTFKIIISKPALGKDNIKTAILTLLVLFIAAGLTYSLYINKGKKNIPDQGNNKETRNSLIKEIAELDDMFEAGKIDETEYKKLREEKKARVLELTNKE